MALSVEVIDDAQAERVIHIEEGQFSDVKAASISPSKLSHTISAFANSDGGNCSSASVRTVRVAG